MNDIRPSYGSGFARFAAESERPELWRGLAGAFAPALGCTGTRLSDISGRSSPATITAGTWTVGRNGPTLQYNGGTTGVVTSRQILSGVDFTVVSMVRTGAQTAVRAFWGQSPTITLLSMSGGQLRFYATGLLCYTAATAANTDYMLVARRLGGIGSVFINGIDKTIYSTTNATAFDAAPFYIGQLGVGSDMFDGQIGATLAYNRALPDSVIRDLSADPLGMFRPRRRVFAVGRFPSLIEIPAIQVAI